jgi:hypothetical protein
VRRCPWPALPAGSAAVPAAWLAWLHDRGRDLSATDQHDLDEWLALSPGQRCKAKGFLDWACAHDHATGIHILAVDAPRPVDVLPDPDARWTQVRYGLLILWGAT